VSYEESLLLFRELEDQTGMALALQTIGNVACEQHDYTRAQMCFNESLGLFRALGSKPRIAESLEGVAWMAACLGRPERAARLFGAAAAVHEAGDQDMDSRDHAEHTCDVAAVRAQLDDASFTAAWAAGRAMALEQAIAYALDGSAVDVKQSAQAVATSNESD
jgi:Tetratricopeptide repeat